MMNGRGNRPLIRVTAKQTTANTAICPANHQRRRISAVIMPIAAIVQLTAITSQDCATAFITPVVQDGASLCRFFPDQFVVRLSVFGKHAPPPHAEADSDQEQTEYHAQYAAGDSRAHGKRVKPGQAAVDIRCPIRIVHVQRPEIP